MARLHPFAYIWLMEMGSCALLTPVALAKGALTRREWHANRGTIAAAALMSPTGYLLVLFAFQFSKTGYVVAAREMSIVLSAVIGSVWFKEGGLRRRLAGAVVVLAGVACVRARPMRATRRGAAGSWSGPPRCAGATGA